MAKSKFGDPHSFLGGKNKPFGKKIASYLEKSPLNPYAQDLKMQWEIHFYLFNIDQSAPKNLIKK